MCEVHRRSDLQSGRFSGGGQRIIHEREFFQRRYEGDGRYETQKNEVSHPFLPPVLCYPLSNKQVIDILFSVKYLKLSFSHEEAKKNALEALKTINAVFKNAYKYVSEIKTKTELLEQKAKLLSKSNLPPASHSKNKSLASSKTTSEFMAYSNINETLKNNSKIKEENTEKPTIKMDIPFKKILIDYAFPILRELCKTPDCCCLTDNNRQEVLLEVKKSLYFWKKNPENNERDLRKELNAPKEVNGGNKRSLLGIKSDSTEWIENFNIGSIMHMNPVKYDDFCFFGDLNYEISKHQLLEKVFWGFSFIIFEKVIFQSICFFTIATEMRFIEIEKHSTKVTSTKDIQSDEYKLSYFI